MILLFPVLLAPVVKAEQEYIFGTDDYSVYSALIDKWYAGTPPKRPVTRVHTGSCATLGLIEDEIEYLKKEIPGLDLEATSDFKAKNIDSYPLRSYINQRAEYDFIDEPEIAKLFSFSDGWKEFYKRYPNSEGILTFSRIGFNLDKTEALASICGQWGHSAGAGLYVTFSRAKDGAWEPQAEVRTWNSWIIETDEESSK